MGGGRGHARRALGELQQALCDFDAALRLALLFRSIGRALDHARLTLVDQWIGVCGGFGGELWGPRGRR